MSKPVSREQLRHAYEALRAHVSGQAREPGLPRGLAVFLRCGLAGWMATWQQLVGTASPDREGQPSAPLPVTGLSHQLTVVLTEMVLGGFVERAHV